MKKSFTRKHMTKEVFEQARKLLDAKVNPELVADVVGRSLTTIKRIEGCQTFEEYRAFVTAYNAAHKPKSLTQVISEVKTKPEQELPTTAFDALISIDISLKQIALDTRKLLERDKRVPYAEKVGNLHV